MKTTSIVTSIGFFTAAAFGLGWTLKPAPPTAELYLEDIYPEWLEISKPQNTPLEASVGEILFDNHHDRAVAVFDKLPGFGFSRIMPAITHDFKNPKFPEQNRLFNDYDFTFIGNDASTRRGKDPRTDLAVFMAMKNGKSSAASASKADLVALEEFEADSESRRHFQIDGDSIVGYGPLRATASCAKCHGVEEGTLLGMFRYRFDLPLDSKNRDLAAVFPH